MQYYGEQLTFKQYKETLMKAIRENNTEIMSYCYSINIQWYRKVLNSMRIYNENI